jgi:hypothetical protein
MCARLKRKHAGAVRRRDTGDASALRDFEAICEATYKERDESLVKILTLDEVSALFGKTSRRADVRFIVRQGPKLRPCDNFKASSKERGCLSREDLFCSSGVRCCSRSLLYISSIEDGWDFEWLFCALEDDDPHAYRNSSSETPQYAALSFVERNAVFKESLPRDLNFGLKIALLQ